MLRYSRTTPQEKFCSCGRDSSLASAFRMADMFPHNHIQLRVLYVMTGFCHPRASEESCIRAGTRLSFQLFFLWRWKVNGRQVTKTSFYTPEGKIPAAHSRNVLLLGHRCFTAFSMTRLEGGRRLRQRFFTSFRMTEKI